MAVNYRALMLAHNTRETIQRELAALPDRENRVLEYKQADKFRILHHECFIPVTDLQPYYNQYIEELYQSLRAYRRHTLAHHVLDMIRAPTYLTRGSSVIGGGILLVEYRLGALYRTGIDVRQIDDLVRDYVTNMGQRPITTAEDNMTDEQYARR